MNILFVSLGCDKNLCDTEFMLGLLEKKGYAFTNEEADADIIIINTCAFINDAKEESVNTILEMAEWKEKGRCKGLIVTGCLSQRYQDEIKEELPEVDAVLGTNSWDAIIEAVDAVLQKKKYQRFDPFMEKKDYSTGRILTKGSHFAYLKIAEGCNKRCTYCIIPSMRGQYRSVPMENLVNQAKELAAYGVKELILVAQETTVYGVDLYEKKSLHLLLEQLAQVEGIEWLRIMYCYPEEIYPELIEEIKTNAKVCHYLDLPIQHVNNDVLKRMARKTTKEELTGIIEQLRREIPDITLRTTVICGFPGETTEAHEELMQFINDTEFDRLGAFCYSPEEGTLAAEMPDQIEEETKQTWQEAVMELSEEVIADKNQTLIGRTMNVLVEGQAVDENVYVCRTYRDAPEVDGYLFLNTSDVLHTGDMVEVRVTGAYEYDLLGELA